MDDVERGRAYAVRLGASVRAAFGTSDARETRASDARATTRTRKDADADVGDGDDDDDEDVGAPVTVFRYDFMSDDADRTKRARVTCSPSGAVEVTFASKSRATEGGVVRYRGAHRERAAKRDDAEDGEAATEEGASDDRGVDCALIFDRATQTFVLERVAGVVGNLRIAREDARSVGAGVLGDGVDANVDDDRRDVDVGRVDTVDDGEGEDVVDASAMFPSSKK